MEYANVLGRMRRLLLLSVFLILISQAWAASLRDIDLDEDSIDQEDDFYVTVDIRSPETNMEVRFYVDDRLFSRKNVGSQTEEVRSSRYDDAEWDKHYIECGKHKVYAQLERGGKVLDNISTTLNVGNLPLFVTEPERPLTDDTLKIKVTDEEDGSTVTGIGIEILDVREARLHKKEVDATGTVTFTPPTAGRYELRIVSGRKYCGRFDFYAKKRIIIDGPFPKDPTAGEIVTIALPSGVGLKGLDMDGNLVFTAYTTLGGGANFTIDTPGEYILVFGELSTEYWALNKSLTISEKPVPEVSVTPEQATLGESILLTINSRGAALNAAVVTVTAPDNSFETFTTSTSGEIVYTPSEIGDYNVRVEKKRYTTVEKKFGARNKFGVDLNPREPNVGDTVNITVRNQMGLTVADASVTVGDVSGVTNSAGVYSFSLAEIKEHTLTVSKARFWDYTMDMLPLGVLKSSLSTYDIELGENVSITVTDGAGTPLTANIAAIVAGESAEITGNTFMVTKTGAYTITVKKEGYNSISHLLNVSAHPLDIDFDFKGNVMTVEVSSHEVPVSGITVKLNEKTAVSDANGRVIFNVDEVGEYYIEVNTVNVNIEYISNRFPRQVVKKYNYLFLIIPIVLVMMLALATIAILHEGHKKLYMITDGLKRIGLSTKKEEVLESSKKSSLSEL